MHGVYFFALAILAYMINDLKEKTASIDTYHVSRVNQANRKIEELEDKIRDLEWRLP